MTPGLTNAQRLTIKNWIVANNQSRFDQSSVDLLNAAKSPDYWVWRTSVTKKELVEQVSQGGTSFVWAGNGFIGRTIQEIECWNQLFNSTLTCNPSLANVRAAFQDIFSGTGNAAANRTHLLNVARRKATVVEEILALDLAVGSTAAPDTMGSEGPIALQEVIDSASAS